MTTLWVVTPVYLDVGCLIPLRRDVLSALEDRDYDRVRFVAVDDSGGLDPEFDRLAALDDVEVATPPFNLGHQRALVFGLRKVLDRIEDDDTVLTMDSDGQDRPQDAPALLAALRSSDNPGEAVIARRTQREESVPFKVLYLFFRMLFRVLTGTVVRSGNFAAYRGWLARRVLRHPYFELCYSSTLLTVAPSTKLVPCPRGARYGGHSRMRPGKLAMHGVRMLMPFTDRIAVRALGVFSAGFALSVVVGVAVVGVKLLTDAAIPGWATYTLVGVTAISLIALGNFVVLFAVFSQSRGVSLADLEVEPGGA